MKAVEVDIQGYFQPIAEHRPWRARLGVGSFLTFFFGRRTKDNGHFRGEWRLWIYQARWRLMHGDHKLADSDSERQTIEVAIRRLENPGCELIKVKFEPKDLSTEFQFGKFRLLVSGADYLENPDEHDWYWLFYMPQNEVLSVGPGGLEVRPSNQ
jgi:hypothetical protein